MSAALTFPEQLLVDGFGFGIFLGLLVPVGQFDFGLNEVGICGDGIVEGLYGLVRQPELSARLAQQQQRSGSPLFIGYRFQGIEGCRMLFCIDEQGPEVFVHFPFFGVF